MAEQCFTSDEVMMLITCIYLVNACRSRLNNADCKAHEWLNSVGKKVFFHLMQALAPTTAYGYLFLPDAIATNPAPANS